MGEGGRERGEGERGGKGAYLCGALCGCEPSSVSPFLL